MAWPTIDTDALLITEVRTLLGEPNARRVSDAEISRYINQATLLIMKRNLASGTTASTALVTNQVEYTAATLGMTDCITVRGVIYNGGAITTPEIMGTAAQALIKMHPRHFSNIRASTAGAPKEWLWFDDILYIWPLPTVAATYGITVFYYKAGTDITSANIFDDYIPMHYQPYLIWYAYSQALMKIGKPEQAIQYRSYFDNFITFHRENDNLYLGVDSADMMNIPDRTEFVG